ncbi:MULTISPECIES: hypothetical protein [unclassified Kitasatospora]|uniref:hypothetical protein n=1 Tax=unclassified Kitasatospora TaxID=2633591 RepID=UPI003814ECB7
MGTSTSGNGAQGGAASIQLPSVAWEMEESGGAGPVAVASATPPAGETAAPVAAAPVAAAVAAPATVPHYGRVAAVPPMAPPGPAPAPPAPPMTPHAVGPGPVEAPAGPEPAEQPGRRARLKRPVFVAAATAGVVLMGLPFLMAGSGRDGDKTVDGAGLSQADQPLAEGPELGDPTVSASPTDPADPTAPGTPGAEAPTDPAPAQDPAPGTTAPQGTEGGTATVPGTTPGTTPGTAPGAASGTNLNSLARPANPPAQGAKPPTTGGTPGGSAPQQPAPGQPAPQQPAPQQPAPGQPAPQQPAPGQPAPPKPPAAPSFSAVNCGNSAAGYAQYGWWEQGTTGWTINSAGGYSGSGCNGKYAALPMSGSATKDDGNSVVWTFTTAPVTSGTCRISVYVPNNSDRKAVGGKPAYYTVQNSSSPNSGTIGSFSVDQTANRGGWVTASGTFPVSGGRIAVMLHSRGIDWGGGGADKAHLAASAVRADCTG